MTSVNQLRVIDLKSSQISQKITKLNNDSRDIQILLRKIKYKKTEIDEAIDFSKNHIASRTNKGSLVNLFGMPGGRTGQYSKNVLIHELSILKGHQCSQADTLLSIKKLQSSIGTMLAESKQTKHQLRVLSDRKEAIFRKDEATKESEMVDSALCVKNVSNPSKLNSSSSSKINERALNAAAQQIDPSSIATCVLNESLGRGALESSILGQTSGPSPTPRANQMQQIENGASLSPSGTAQVSITHTLPSGDSVYLDVNSGSAKEISVSIFGFREETRRVLRTKRDEISKMLDELGFYQPLVQVGSGGKGD